MENEVDNYSLSAGIQKCYQLEREVVISAITGKKEGVFYWSPERKDHLLFWLMEEVLKLREEVGKLKNV
jgi:hypothetical protein